MAVVANSTYHLSNPVIESKGLGITSNGYFTSDDGWDKEKPTWTTTIKDGRLENFTLTNSGVCSRAYAVRPTGKFTWHRNEPQRIYNVGVFISLDDKEYKLVETIPVDEFIKSYYIDIKEPFQYVKLEILETTDDIQTTLSLQYLDMLIAEEEYKEENDCIMLEYIFNLYQKYLLILYNETIMIYQDGELKDKIQANGLKQEYFKDLKYSYIDDTIIFTHEDIHPKRLIRKTDGWEYGDYPLKNIPYRLFGQEIIEQKTVGITPSELEGTVKITADSGIFNADYVGQYIDGNGGRVKITEYISSTVLNGYTVIPFYTKDKITKWDYIHGYELVWSETRGYPRTCCFANQRLFFGGSKESPSTIWASRIGDYTNFKNTSNNANDGINFDMASNAVILNMVFNRGLHIFTSDFEASSPEGSFTPNEFRMTPVTQNGSIGSIRPQIINGVICYIEKNGKSLLNYVYDYQQANYTSNNISKFTDLIKNPKRIAVEINSAQDIGDRLFIVLDDGTLLVDCLSFSEEVQAMTQFITEGKIYDICSLMGETYLLVKRNKYMYLEKLENLRSDNTQYLPINGDKITGLKYYNDNTLCVYDDKNTYYGKYPVIDGELYLPMELNGMYYVGIPFDYEIVGNPIAINHKTFNIKKRIAQAQIVCKDTQEIEFCNQIKRDCEIYDFKACTIYGKDITYNIKGEFYPVDILSISLTINYEG